MRAARAELRRVGLLIAISLATSRVHHLRGWALLPLLALLLQARLAHQFVALLVYEQLALHALESLPAQSPNSILTKGAEGALQAKKKFKFN